MGADRQRKTPGTLYNAVKHPTRPCIASLPQGILEYSQIKIKRFKGRTEARFFQFGANTGRSRFERPAGAARIRNTWTRKHRVFVPSRTRKYGVWLSKHALVRAGPKTLRRTGPGHCTKTKVEIFCTKSIDNPFPFCYNSSIKSDERLI